MQTCKKIMNSLATVLLVLLLAGCSFPKEPTAFIFAPASKEQDPQNNAISRRFEKANSENPTAVESAIELSEKYAKLTEEMALLRNKSQELAKENNMLKEKLAVTEPRLKQTQKELDDANDLLIQMTIDLNNWKTNILGYRDEMRAAEKAQLDALLKILEILGGQINAEVFQEQTTAKVTASPENDSLQHSDQTQIAR